VIQAVIEGFLALKLAIPVMVKAGHGSITNSSSVAGLIGSAGMCASVANKHAVVGLARTTAVDWRARDSVVFLACDDAGSVNGACYAVDGELTAA